MIFGFDSLFFRVDKFDIFQYPIDSSDQHMMIVKVPLWGDSIKAGHGIFQKDWYYFS